MGQGRYSLAKMDQNSQNNGPIQGSFDPCRSLKKWENLVGMILTYQGISLQIFKSIELRMRKIVLNKVYHNTLNGVVR